MQKVTFHIISHTHWDREWYRTFEAYRSDLIDLIDDLLKVLKYNRNFIFHLDGYTLLIEDYLEIKPSKRELIKKYIKSGNILTGPWYVLSDEFLTSGEATVRNLIYGTNFAKQLGNVMNVGYMPDQFGHIAQMPQILKGFGIDSAVVGRGIQDNYAEHSWYALNGEMVLTISLTHWYNNAQRLPEDPEDLNKYLKNIYKKQGKTTLSKHLLLMNGCDHLYVQSNLPKILKRRSNNDIWNLKQSKLTKAINEIQKKIKPDKLPVRKGELRDDNNKFILASTLSSRVYLKLANYFLQTKLEKVIEPLAALLYLSKKNTYPYDEIKYAWKLLLQNHPHDSICGCSIDEVHKEMEIRFDKVKQLLEKLESKLLLSLQKNPYTTNHLAQKKDFLQLINLTNEYRDEIFEVELEFPLGVPANYKGQEKSSEPKITKNEIKSIKIYDPTGQKEADFEVLTSYKVYKMVSTRHDVPALQIYQVIKLLLKGQINPYSISALRIKTNQDKKNVNLISKTILSKYPLLPEKELRSPPEFENDFYYLKVNKNGTINILLREKNYTFKSLHFYTLENDNGDLYRFIPSKKPKTTFLTNPHKWKIKIIEENKFRKIFLLVTNQEGLKIETKMTCYRNTPRIDFKSKINNKNKNKRLRLHFPSMLGVKHIVSDTQFGIIERKRPPNSWKDPAYVQPLHNWISHNNGTIGLGFFGKGIAEYELYENGNGFAITLIRSIGKLSIVRSHSLIETPEGQCIRDIEFSYAVFPHTGPYWKTNIQSEQIKHQIPILVNQSDLEYNVNEFIKLNGNVQVSILKRSEKNEKVYILRIFNPSSKLQEHCSLYIKPKIKYIKLLKLNEEEYKLLKISKRKLNFKIKPFEIVTFGLYV